MIYIKNPWGSIRDLNLAAQFRIVWNVIPSRVSIYAINVQGVHVCIKLSTDVDLPVLTNCHSTRPYFMWIEYLEESLSSIPLLTCISVTIYKL